ncbi:hypothetical protein D3C72_1621260 [compost metagenome]
MRQNHQNRDRHAESDMRQQHRREAELHTRDREQNQERSADDDIGTNDQHVVQRQQRILGSPAPDPLNGECADHGDDGRDCRRQQRDHQRVDDDDDQPGVLEHLAVVFEREALEFMHRPTAVERVIHQIENRCIQHDKDKDQIQIGPAVSLIFHAAPPSGRPAAPSPAP